MEQSRGDFEEAKRIEAEITDSIARCTTIEELIEYLTNCPHELISRKTHPGVYYAATLTLEKDAILSLRGEGTLKESPVGKLLTAFLRKFCRNYQLRNKVAELFKISNFLP